MICKAVVQKSPVTHLGGISLGGCLAFHWRGQMGFPGRVYGVEDSGKLHLEAAVESGQVRREGKGQRESEAKEQKPGKKEEDQERRHCKN